MPAVTTRHRHNRPTMSSATSPSPPPSYSHSRLFLATISANLGGLLVGLQLALFSGILEMTSFSNTFSTTTSDKSLITTSVIFGAIFGSFPAGPLCDKLGRRRTLLLVALTFTSGTLIMALAQTTLQIILGRFIAGIAYAVANIVCPMYSAEVSPPHLRGIIVNLYQLFITVGIFLAQVINWRYWDSSSWTIPLYYALIPGLCMILMVSIATPESPSWLQNQSRHTEALSAAHKLNIPPPHLDEESQSPKAEKAPSLLAILSDKSARRRILIGAGLGAAQQCTGINAVIFFGPALVADVLHLSGSSAPFRAAAIVGFANFAASVFSMGVIERFGRRQLLLAAGLPMIVSLTVLGMMRDGIVQRQAWVGVGALMVFIVAFAITYGPLPFVVASEIFPVGYKGVGMGICTLVLMGFAAGVGGGFLWAVERLGGMVYFVFAFCVFGSSLFVWGGVPETRNLSLQEIDDMLG